MGKAYALRFSAQLVSLRGRPAVRCRPSASVNRLEGFHRLRAPAAINLAFRLKTPSGWLLFGMPRALGFSLPAVRQLLEVADQPDKSCARADAMVRAQLAKVRNRIARLRSLEAARTQMLEQFLGGRIRDCRVIEALARHEAGA